MAQRRLIVCNTTPVINLAEIGHLGLLDQLLGKFSVPPAVVAELKAKRELFPAAAEAADELEVVAPADKLLVAGLSSMVHPGEAECLALAMENPGSLLILDDRQARTVASSRGLPFTGTLGILSEAKAGGLIPRLSPVIRDLRERARFWISPALEARVLRDAGET